MLSAIWVQDSRDGRVYCSVLKRLHICAAGRRCPHMHGRERWLSIYPLLAQINKIEWLRLLCYFLLTTLAARSFLLLRLWTSGVSKINKGSKQGNSKRGWRICMQQVYIRHHPDNHRKRWLVSWKQLHCLVLLVSLGLTFTMNPWWYVIIYLKYSAVHPTGFTPQSCSWAHKHILEPIGWFRCCKS